MVSTNILSSTVFNIANNNSFLSSKLAYRMISEESCDTEDYDAENSALHHRNKLHLKIYENGKQSFKL